MCGICGILSLDGSERPDPDVLAAMNGAIEHRGPDSEGSLLDGPLAMAMRRLSIIDLAGGDQPIGNEDGSVQVIQNGEIYNYRELNEELRGRGHTLATRSDTETIVHLYEQYGLGFAERLRGMFAIAIWDRRNRRLVLARDRYGIKPLYYRADGGRLSFASELKALLRQPNFPRDVDLGALEAYLALNYVPAPMTIFEGTRKLPLGHLLIAERGEVRLQEYAAPRPSPAGELRRESPDELAAELRERLRDSVRAHMVSDVPVGVLLSGGIDSGTLTALASEINEEPVNTFTIAFKERGFSEAAEARLVAERFGTNHHELTVEPDAVELLPKVVETFDEPFADDSALPTYLVSQLAAEHVKVVLSGEGGDELFGGYYSYIGDLWAPRIGPAATALRSVIERLPSRASSRRLEDRLKRFARGAHLPQPDRHAAWSQVFSPEARERLLTRRNDGFDPLQAHRDRYARSTGAEELSRTADLDMGVYMVDDILVKIDRASMAHSLESRVPFLDPEVTGFALALPARHKVRVLSKKWLFRRAVGPLLPREIVRGRKRGFNPPVSRWLRGELLPFAREVLSPQRIRDQGFLDPAAVSAVIDTHVAGRDDLSRNIWGLICFSLWHDRYVAPATVM
jgi:asparagine synthase (glutamine-hydrolysing)